MDKCNHKLSFSLHSMLNLLNSKKLRHFFQIADEERWMALIGNALNPVLVYHPAILSEMVTACRQKLSLNLVQARIVLATVL